MSWICLVLVIGMSLDVTTPALPAPIGPRNPGMAKLHERPLRIFRPLSQHLEARQPAAGRQWDHLPAPDRPEPRRPLRPHEPHGGIEPGQAADARRVYLRAPAHHHRALRKKKIALAWQKEQDTLLAGFPAKRLAFTYQDEHQTAMFELHIFSLGRNEGRGVRVKVPASAQADLLPAVTKMLETYQPGRDQNAVSPLAQTSATH